jgi:cytochrome c-type biogenesis protein CcmH
MTILLFLLLQLRAPDAAQFVGPPKGKAIAGAELTQRTHEVSQLLRCPVCQGMAVADSPAVMAVNMKEQVRELLSRGYTEEQILEYFERSYGQFVLLRPRFQGMNSLVWLLPMFALTIGAVLVVMKMRKLSVGPPLQAASVADSDDPYLARVRELVGGDE